MKEYILKPNKPPFEMVDGPLAGRRYEHGTRYSEIPHGLDHRFMAVPETAKAKAAPDKKPQAKDAGATN